MRILGTNIAAGEFTAAFRTVREGQVWIDVQSDASTIWSALQISHDGENYDTFVADGVTQAIESNDLRVFHLPGGVYIRLAVEAGAAGAIDVRFDGIHARLVP